jgi:hypothetical protein
MVVVVVRLTVRGEREVAVEALVLLEQMLVTKLRVQEEIQPYRAQVRVVL